MVRFVAGRRVKAGQGRAELSGRGGDVQSGVRREMVRFGAGRRVRAGQGRAELSGRGGDVQSGVRRERVRFGAGRRVKAGQANEREVRWWDGADLLRGLARSGCRQTHPLQNEDGLLPPLSPVACPVLPVPPLPPPLPPGRLPRVNQQDLLRCEHACFALPL